MEKILSIVSIGMIVAYNFYAAIIYKGNLPSTSESWFKTGRTFQLVMVFSAILLTPYLMSISTYWLAYGTSLGLVVVGMFPDFKKNNLNKYIHYSGAVLSASGALTIILNSSVSFFCIGLGVFITGLLALTGKNLLKNIVFYLELLVFSSLFVYLATSY